MRILLLIDSLAPGGAQRQICLLANGLAERGHQVVLLTYHAIDFFDYLVSSEVRLVRLGPHRKWQRVFLLRRAVRREKPDTVVAFLEASALYAELGGLPRRPYRLVVSERNLDTRFGWFFWLKTNAHRLADRIAPNTHAQTNLLKRKAPWLSMKLRPVPNMVETSRFVPTGEGREPQDMRERFRFLTLGRFQSQKNGENLLRGFARARAESRRSLGLDWYGNRFFDRQGNPTGRSEEYLRLLGLAEALGITDHVRFGDAVQAVERLYPRYDAFVLASRREGSPNVLLEAMACGLPVVASDVADNGRIIAESKAGYLFRPESVEEIAAGIVKLASAEPDQLSRMGLAGRIYVESEFGRTAALDRFEEVVGATPGPAG